MGLSNLFSYLHDRIDGVGCSRDDSKDDEEYNQLTGKIQAYHEILAWILKGDSQ